MRRFSIRGCRQSDFLGAFGEFAIEPCHKPIHLAIQIYSQIEVASIVQIFFLYCFKIHLIVSIGVGEDILAVDRINERLREDPFFDTLHGDSIEIIPETLHYHLITNFLLQYWPSSMAAIIIVALSGRRMPSALSHLSRAQSTESNMDSQSRKQPIHSEMIMSTFSTGSVISSTSPLMMVILLSRLFSLIMLRLCTQMLAFSIPYTCLAPALAIIHSRNWYPRRCSGSQSRCPRPAQFCP